MASALKAPANTKEEYLKYRPSIPVRKAPSIWWKYAFNCVVDDLREKRLHWSWPQMKERRDDRILYINLWKRKQMHIDVRETSVDDLSEESDNDESENEENKSNKYLYVTKKRVKKSGILNLREKYLLKEIESRRSVEDLLFFRYLADLELKNDTNSHITTSETDSESASNVDSTSQAKSSWGFSWGLGWGTKSTVSDETSTPNRIPEIELKELYNILGYDPTKKTNASSGLSNEGMDKSISGYIVSRMSFTLGRGSLTLANDPETKKFRCQNDYSMFYTSKPIILAMFQDLNIGVCTKQDSIKVFRVQIHQFVKYSCFYGCFIMN